MSLQASTTIPPVWLWLVIRGEPTLLTNMVCVFSSLPSDLRVFPERYVVCVSCPEDASVHHGNPSLAAVSTVYTPLFPLPVAWQKTLQGSVCYYRDVLPNCALTSYMLSLFTWGGGAQNPQGLWADLLSENERMVGVGVRWGPKLQSHPVYKKFLLPHCAKLPQLYSLFFVKLRHGVVENLNIIIQ